MKFGWCLHTERLIPLDFAWTRFALGDVEAGLDWLSGTFEDRSFELLSMKVDPQFDPWREQPRFQALQERLRLH